MIENNILKNIDLLVKGDLEMREKLVNLFISQTSNDIIRINACLQTEDWSDLKKVAHKLKSSFIYLDMPRPIELTEALRTASGTNIKKTKAQAKELVIICEQTIKTLKDNCRS